MNGIGFFVFLVLFLFPTLSGGVPIYNLSVEIDIRSSGVRGTAEIIPDEDKEFVFKMEGLKVLWVTPKPGSYDKNDAIRMYGKKGEPIRIGYEGVFKDSLSSNIINENGVFLTGNWYPTPDVLCEYHLTARLPVGFEAVSEAEWIKKDYEEKWVTFGFDFPHPLEGMHLMASNRFIVTGETYKGVNISTYFFKEDNHLSKDYIEYTKRYIDTYEGLISKFPYKRFAVVENPFPTGYSFPTFTLLGQSVLRLPFIVETSLGHEVLHQWFGNYVYIDPDKGNWSEGLTTYLSDHLYEDMKGRGWQYRKNMLIDYHSYVSPDRDFPLRDFRERYNGSSSAIGYGKSAMVFHLLKNELGEKGFYDSLRYLVKQYGLRRASWGDVRAAFERYYKGDLGRFFEEWLGRKGLPHLEVKNPNLRIEGGKFHLTFDILQRGDPYRLSIPFSIYYSNNTKAERLIGVSKERESVSLYLDDEPLKVVMDEDYDVPRELTEREIPPVISRLLGVDRTIFVIPDGKRDKYEGLIDSFKGKGVEIKTPGETGYQDIRSSSLVLLDRENPMIKRLFGDIAIGDEGFSVITKRNPWNDERVIAVLHGESKEEVELGCNKMIHYGKYSNLAFKNGMNTHKGVAESERGMVIRLRKPTRVVYVPLVADLERVIEGTKDKRIIYIGERHDRFSHHMSQLNMIKGLYRLNKRLAIGMEAFQRPFQRHIDDYIKGRIDERRFLKDTEYFKRWGLDYNLYKPIIDFAKENGIPIVALNIDGKITSKVSKSGLDSLTEEERMSLPAEMDFSDEDYRERLREVFKEHPNSRQGNFDFFLQAQIVWDETMAESIDGFLKEHPDYQIVVLAGSEHVKYGSGIPKRAFRRNGYPYSIILNDEDPDKNIGDYVLYPEEIEGVTSPKLGVLLDEDGGKLKVSEFTEDSVGKKGGLEKGDIILSIDGHPVRSVEDIRIALFYKTKGGVARIKVLKGSGEKREVEIGF